MAKNKSNSSIARALPSVEPDPAPLPAVARTRAVAQPGFGEQVSGAVNGTVQTMRSVLPARRLPVYLAGAALAVARLVEAPVLLGFGLAYEALRRWETWPTSAAAR